MSSQPPNWEVVPEGTIFATALIGGIIAGIVIAIVWMVMEWAVEAWKERKEESIEDATADPQEVESWTPKVDPYWIAKDIEQYLVMKEIIDDAREYIAKHSVTKP